MCLSGSRVGVGAWGVQAQQHLPCPYCSFIPWEEEHGVGGDISRDLHALTLRQGHVLPQWSSGTFASKLLATEG